MNDTSFKQGDRVIQSKYKRKGTFVCGNGTICTVDFDDIGMTAWIPVEQLRLVKERRKS